MKICVIQPDVTRIGGSISTILQFADCFKELGHEVKIHATFKNRFPKKLIKKEKSVLDFYGCNCLNFSDIIWDLNIQKHKYDLCFTRGQLHHLTNNIPTISWVIVNSDIKYSDNILQYWTNSNTTKQLLDPSIYEKIEIVYPPHDYSFIRKNIQKNKEYDIVSILRGNDFNDKGIPLYAKVIKNLNNKSLLITTAPRDGDLRKIKAMGVPYILNQSRKQVSDILGKSKIFFFPSYYESCPLVIYEALNAGCHIVSRNVGAVKEQLNGLGEVFNKDNQCLDILKKELNKEVDVQSIIQRGKHFDRKTVKDNIQRILNDSIPL